MGREKTFLLTSHIRSHLLDHHFFGMAINLIESKLHKNDTKFKKRMFSMKKKSQKISCFCSKEVTE